MILKVCNCIQLSTTDTTDCILTVKVEDSKGYYKIFLNQELISEFLDQITAESNSKSVNVRLEYSNLGFKQRLIYSEEADILRICSSKDSNVDNYEFLVRNIEDTIKLLVIVNNKGKER